MMPSQITYLDNNATTPLRPQVLHAMTEVLQSHGNASSIHAAGRQARARIEAAHHQVAGLIAAKSDQIIFTSGGTEANNLALRGVSVARVLMSAIEHESVVRAAPAGSAIIPVLASGIIDLGALDALLADADAPALVSVMLANNETGIVQPVAQASAIAHSHGALMHCDAVQAVGKLPVDCHALGVDMLTLSAHKFGGPQGAGALIVRNGVEITSQMRGGGQERGRRGGTENVAAITGFAKAAALAMDALPGMIVEISAMRDRLEEGVAAITPQVVFFGRSQHRLCNTSCFALPGVAAAIQVMNLDLAGVAVSAGAACSSGKVTRSAVLSAMGVGETLAGSAIRVSLGWATTADDIGAFLAAWEMIAGRTKLRQAS
ncbi:MAG: cysteine desulfurase family protein [Alphaproteobacteria bacterium]